MGNKSWILYAGLLVAFWGVWGAFSALPTQLYRYPDQMVYIIWAFTMLIPCYVSLRGKRFDRRGIAALYGLLIGLAGAGGQLILFKTLTIGPAYLIFPVVSISPVITVLLALVILREKVSRLGWAGVILALVSIIMFSVPDSSKSGLQFGAWLMLAVIVCVCWGSQAFLMKRAANAGVNDASIFAYMTISGLLLVPVAFLTMPENGFDFGWKAPALTTAIQLLNAIGALFLVMAMSRGKAVIVSPCTNALAPILTIVLSLTFYHAFPSVWSFIGIVLALCGSTLMVYSEEAAGAAPTAPSASMR
ncbi:DMT family transporter [Rhodanobacter glycinis]|jgi:drug/metabolite transporter (DMT)-like permease|uniref:DMT family transporter n=1 Tax=Rhodanobacter glycinis TaxID=582702 RepID=A0A5B9DYU5_9GAMM|nr:DMT family transporter [Rhodanobacter glycinis]QEE23330.1 DMT family transporter [Rhodanobacter glycinis]